MSVTDNDAWQQVTIDAGLDTEHILDFPVIAATDLVVIRDRSDTISTLVKDTDYSVSLDSSYIPTVTLLATPTEGDVLTFYRNEAVGRSDGFSALGDFTTTAINSALDALVRQMQQLERDITHCLRVPEQDGALTTLLDAAADRASLFLQFDSSGNATAATISATLDAAVAAAQAAQAAAESAETTAVAASTRKYIFALSDETTTIVAATGVFTFRVPEALTSITVRASLTTASSSGVVTVDINKNGTTILSTKLTIDANEKTSKSAATAAVVSVATCADDDEFTFDIDTAGTGATGLKVTIEGTPA